jgi:CDP-glucose 4,6-dehydratase
MKSFWEGKKVVITGHTGFKGSWLSLWLQHLGAQIVGISLDPPTHPSLYSEANVSEGMLSLREDIRDGKAIKKIFKKHKPEVVFHLAAQPLVRYSYEQPVETYETNVMGTLNVLEGIRSINTVRSVVMITTDKCYQNQEWVWGYRESDPLGGHDPYSSSKGAAEILISSYRDSYFPLERFDEHRVAIASARAGNVIGGGDWAKDRLMPDIIYAFQKDKEVHVRNPNAIRPWQHVLDPLSGYMQLAEKLFIDGREYSGPWNFGPRKTDERTVKWVVDRMSQYWGSNASWTHDESDHPHEANYLKLDCSKSHSNLGWEPKWGLDDALLNVIEWYKNKDFDNINHREACMKQIIRYMTDGRIDE